MAEKTTRFISEEIKMIEVSDCGEPVSFRWRKVDHRVLEVLKYWQDWGHPAGAFKKSWKNRKHRNYFEVRTDSDYHLLIYFDRGVKPSSPRKWAILEHYES